MILVDFHQTMIANIMRMIYSNNVIELDENLLRHNILNSLLKYRRKFKQEYGDIIICCDDKNYWRKDVFPFYKAKRKKQKEDSGIDWDSIHKFMNNMKKELIDFIPFPVIQVEKCEADDVIACLNTYLHSETISGKNVIISRDKDLRQLLSERTVVYNPIDNEFHSYDTGNYWEQEDALTSHIIHGDVADGIPNILSDDDTFVVEGKRQKRMTQSKVDFFMSDLFTEEEIVKTHFIRNQTLIDFNFIPPIIRLSIIEEYENVIENKKSYDSNKLLEYIMENRLNNMMENIQDFYI